MRLEDMELGTECLKHVKWTRNGAGGASREFHVAIRVLTQDELDRAKVNAARAVKEFDGGADIENLEERVGFIKNAEMAEILSMALRDPDYKDPAHTEPWAGSATIKKKLLPNEMAFLIGMYEAHQGEVSPPYRQMTQKQFDDIRRAIAQTGSADPLAFFASHVQRAYVVTTAVQLETLLTARSSDSSSSSDSPTSEPPRPPSSDAPEAEGEPSGDEVVLP